MVAGARHPGLAHARRLGLHLTDRCQLDCDHCLRDPGGHAQDLDLAIALALVDEAAALGIRHVSMTGGEPTIYPGLLPLLDAIADREMTWDLVTNGRRFADVLTRVAARPSRLAACHTVAFSVDGASDAVHDAIRGEGQRREVLAAMAAAVAFGVPFLVTAALHARNVHELEAIAREHLALGAFEVRFAMTQPTGTHLDAGLYLDAAAWRSARDRALALRAEGLAVTLAEGWPEDAALANDEPRCGPLRGETLHVDHHGRLTLCCLHSGLPLDADDPSDVGAATRGLSALADALTDARRGACERVHHAAASDPPSDWRDFGCNVCLAAHGRPHWADHRASGPVAKRPRWRGRSLRVVAG